MRNTIIAQVIVYERPDGWYIGLRVGLYVCRYGQAYSSSSEAEHDAICMYGVKPDIVLEGGVIK